MSSLLEMLAKGEIKKIVKKKDGTSIGYVIENPIKKIKYAEKKSSNGFTKNTMQHSSKKLRKIAKHSRKINRRK